MTSFEESDPCDRRRRLGRNLTHGLLESLGRAIVSGEYDARKFPTEGELAKQHGVSRSVAREAVKMLTAKGLLSARPRQGTVIQPKSEWSHFDTDVLSWVLDQTQSIRMLEHLNQLCMAVEPEAAALAARFGAKESIARVKYELSLMQAASRGFDTTVGGEIAFHLAVLNASQNPLFIQLGGIVATAHRSRHLLWAREYSASRDRGDYAAVYDAVFEGDPEAARSAMTRIIDKDFSKIDAKNTDAWQKSLLNYHDREY